MTQLEQSSLLMSTCCLKDTLLNLYNILHKTIDRLAIILRQAIHTGMLLSTANVTVSCLVGRLKNTQHSKRPTIRGD
jgi:hypothetical protein